MTLKRSVRNFIIGKDRYVKPHWVFKSTMLRGHLAILVFSIGCIYFLLDLFNGVYRNIPIHCIVLSTTWVMFFFNRIAKYFLANVIFLTAINAVVYVFAASYPADIGISLFFITIGLSALGLFGYQQRVWGFAFVLISFALFMMTSIGGFSLLKEVSLPAELVRIHYLVNSTLAFAISILILFFLIDLNHHSEKSLRKNEASLIFTTQELKKSRSRFELAIKGSNAGIWEWDAASNTVYNSPVWKTMLGYQENELKSLTMEGFFELVHPGDRGMVELAFEQHLTTHEPYKAEFRMIRKDGSEIWVADRGTGIVNEKGETVQMVGSIVDISERKEAERRIIQQNELLAKTNDELDRFVYSTSHDLRAPLSSVLGLITVAEKTNDPAEISACLGMMKDRIWTLENFIREIIDYSRNTRLDVKYQSVKIFPLIQNVVENLRFSEGAENIFVRYNISPDLEISTDESRLKVIVNNLIGNSIKYYDTQKDNPFISIEASKKDDVIHIGIEDNGIGIAPEHQSKIFDMFYRACEQSQGSGLGLYIVKETIEKLRGTVDVSSTPGKGTLFSLQFPETAI